jgi:hypothetical protein
MKRFLSTEDIETTVSELCASYNTLNEKISKCGFETANDKMLKAVTIIAICELSRLYQNQCGEEAHRDSALKQS